MTKETEQEKVIKKNILLSILSKVNLNTVVTAICGVAIVALQTCNHQETAAKLDTTTKVQAQDTVKTKIWRARFDSLASKVDHIYQDNLRQDSLIAAHR